MNVENSVILFGISLRGKLVFANWKTLPIFNQRIYLPIKHCDFHKYVKLLEGSGFYPVSKGEHQIVDHPVWRKHSIRLVGSTIKVHSTSQTCLTVAKQILTWACQRRRAPKQFSWTLVARSRSMGHGAWDEPMLDNSWHSNTMPGPNHCSTRNLPRRSWKDVGSSGRWWKRLKVGWH